MCRLSSTSTGQHRRLVPSQAGALALRSSDPAGVAEVVAADSPPEAANPEVVGADTWRFRARGLSLPPLACRISTLWEARSGRSADQLRNLERPAACRCWRCAVGHRRRSRVNELLCCPRNTLAAGSLGAGSVAVVAPSTTTRQSVGCRYQPARGRMPVPGADTATVAVTSWCDGARSVAATCQDAKL